ncbi:MAG: DNA internalization-related competence protein ComEC/Rec2 [Armatimonadota bacterium]
MASTPEAAERASTPSPRVALPGFLAARPLAVLCVAFVAGVAGGSLFRLSGTLLVGAAVAAALACVFALVGRWAGPSIVVAFFVAGAGWRSVTDVEPANSISRFASGAPRIVRGVVISPVKAIGGAWRFVLRAEGLADGGEWRRVVGKVSVRTRAEPTYGEGARLEVRARVRAVPGPGDPDFDGYARYEWLHGVRAAMTLGPESVRRVEGPRETAGLRVGEVRDAIRRRLRDTMPGANASLYGDLVASMVFGVSAAPLPQQIVEDFRRTGTVHVLVVSGGQVSLLATALVLLCRGRRRGIRLPHVLLVLPALVFFCAVVGYGAPVRRALSVCVVVLFAAASRRDYDPYTALALAAFIMLLIDPRSIQGVSTQMSFAAALGVIHFQPRRPLAVERRPLWKRVLIFTFFGTLGAWLMTVPLSAHYFNSFPRLALAANLVVVPMVAILVPTGMLAALLAFVLPPLAVAVNHVNRALAGLIMASVHYGARLPFGFASNTHMPAHVVAIWYVALIGTVGLLRSSWRPRLDARMLVPVVLIVLAAGALWHALWVPPADLTVTMLDVGDGDCLLVRSSSGRTMMIDGGQRTFRARSDVARRVILPYLMTQRITRIDYLVVTHSHDDHVNGLADVLAEVPVGVILEGPTRGDTHAYQRYEETARSLGIARRPARRGMKIDLGGGAVVGVLAPGPTAMSGTVDDVNNNSVVLKVAYGEVTFLLVGDLQAEGERKLMRDPVNLGATILKVAHHGSAAASSSAFLRRVQPEVALISCSAALGQEHPAPEVIQRLKSVGVSIWRTDVHRTITVTTDGSGYRVRASR